MPVLLLVRHGETAWNAEHRWQGHHDAPLNDVGTAEAQAVASRVALDRPAALYSSDLRRARETAEEVAQRAGLEPVFDARWREVDVGEWLGLTPEEVAARYPDGYRRWLAGGTGWSEGETYAQMAKRGLAGARDIVARHTGSEAPIVIVTHGGVIRALVLHILGLPLEARRFLGTGPTSTITEVDARAPDWRLRSFNDAGHRPRA